LVCSDGVEWLVEWVGGSLSISVRQLAAGVLLFGLVTIFFMMIGPRAIGQVFALIQLGVLVGLPLAWLLRPQLRSTAVVGVVGVALSIALSGLAVQSLIWLSLAGREVIVAAATLYGVVLAWLLSSDGRERHHEELPEFTTS